MNTSNIKRYAPQARKNFIAAITKQAAKYGISASGIEPLEQKGDLALIGGRPFPASIIKPRAALVQKIKQFGFTQVMEQVAYSWFNRLCAIRYMELKDYLEHGRRVLSSAAQGSANVAAGRLPAATPTQSASYQILDDCLDIALPGLDQTKVRNLKLDGTQDEQLYRELLLAQCYALHKAMPFLFERIGDETELLLPENLTKTDSLIHELVNAIPEEDWQSVEIIGWLYQFYISEKKDEVIGKVVKSEDIPAATQLFTPNWIVKYMVQNSLGAHWLATYPASPLKASMEYYITPAQQTDEVNAQLKAITPSALNPEALTLIDPACGSGHILVEAYDVFKTIYLERGYRQRDVAQLILEKNLFGLDVDQRAAQLTGFALMMKGRDDDRRLFERDIKLNVMAMVDSTGFDVDALVGGVNLAQYGLEAKDLIELKNLFEHATTFGSLIQVPSALKVKLPALIKLSDVNSDDLFVKESLENVNILIRQTELLAQQYDSVVANPPYMGGKNQTVTLKGFLRENYSGYDKDLFSAFFIRNIVFGKPDSELAFIAPYVWMFISSFEKLRAQLISDSSFTSLIQLEYNAFEPACIPVASFCLKRRYIEGFTGSYIKLSDFKGHQNQSPKVLEAISNPECGWLFRAKPDDFKRIPGTPIAYWLSRKMIEPFKSHKLGSILKTEYGIITGDNGKFLRFWFEVSQKSCRKWIPFNKGGSFRKWYGNLLYVVNWESAEDFVNFAKNKPLENTQFYSSHCITWSDVTSGSVSFRLIPPGYLSSNTGPTAHPNESKYLLPLLAYLNTNYIRDIAGLLNPTLHFTLGDFCNLPFVSYFKDEVENIAKEAVAISKREWDSREESRDFYSLPMIRSRINQASINESWLEWSEKAREEFIRLRSLEEENNNIFISACGLQDELAPDVAEDEITLLETDLKADMQRLISYSIGCMMGRYSLDEPGLIYAHSGNEGFDPTRYQKFKADDDGIIPLTDKEWFSDDAANRLEEFIATAWDAAHLEENLGFLADNLSPKKGEGSRETLRRYLCDSFYKDHLQTYKKRPIYWLFTSGKQKAFQCLVYLHRYNQGTLARMRTEYVIPLTAKLAAHVNKLEQDKDASTSTPDIKKLEKELARLYKQQAELNTFDENLRHGADQRINLDLDDGVKVNYGKFGDLLADVKAITGGANE